MKNPSRNKLLGVMLLKPIHYFHDVHIHLDLSGVIIIPTIDIELRAMKEGDGVVIRIGFAGHIS